MLRQGFAETNERPPGPMPERTNRAAAVQFASNPVYHVSSGCPQCLGGLV